MHELALVSAAIEQAVAVARQAGARRVEQLTFALAPDGHVTPEAVVTLVEALGRGTLVEGARVAVETSGGGSPELVLTSIDVDLPSTTA
jgi:Zn finger protein HypA/HybF involved in hydrogenase expression